MVYKTDIQLMHNVDDGAMATAFATAFGIPVSSVSVVWSGSDEVGVAWRLPRIRLVVQRDDQRLYEDPTSWPIELGVTFSGDRPGNELDILRSLAKGLGVPLVGATAEDEGSAVRLVFPDGYAPVRHEDEDVELTADDWRRLAQYDHPVAIAS